MEPAPDLSRHARGNFDDVCVTIAVCLDQRRGHGAGSRGIRPNGLMHDKKIGIRVCGQSDGPQREDRIFLTRIADIERGSAVFIRHERDLDLRSGLFRRIGEEIHHVPYGRLPDRRGWPPECAPARRLHTKHPLVQIVQRQNRAEILAGDNSELLRLRLYRVEFIADSLEYFFTKLDGIEQLADRFDVAPDAPLYAFAHTLTFKIRLHIGKPAVGELVGDPVRITRIDLDFINEDERLAHDGERDIAPVRPETVCPKPVDRVGVFRRRLAPGA